eukprot:187671_1
MVIYLQIQQIISTGILIIVTIFGYVTNIITITMIKVVQLDIIKHFRDIRATTDQSSTTSTTSTTTPPVSSTSSGTSCSSVSISGGSYFDGVWDKQSDRLINGKPYYNYRDR